MGIWSSWMDETVVVAPRDSVDDYGQYSAGAQRNVDARIEPGAREIRNAEGVVIEVTTVLYTHDEIGRDEFVWLPGTDTTDISEARTPQRVIDVPDATGGDNAYEVHL